MSAARVSPASGIARSPGWQVGRLILRRAAAPGRRLRAARKRRCTLGRMEQPAPGPNGNVYLVSAARTPIGKFGGVLAGVPATELGADRDPGRRGPLGPPAGRPDRRGLHGPGAPGAARARRRPARRCSRPGLADTTPATTINRVCGSGLKAIMLAAASIRAGDGDVYVAGGMESMNGAPFLLRKARFGYRLGNGTLEDSAVLDGLWCSVEDCHMGTHAERVAIQQRRVARGPGRVRVPEPPAGGRGDRRRPVRRRDGAGHDPRREGPRDGRHASTRARGATRRSRRSRGSRRCSRCPRARTGATRRSGTVTAGNAPGITDGGGGDGRRLGARGGAVRPARPSPGSWATRRPRSRRSGCSSPRSTGVRNLEARTGLVARRLRPRSRSTRRSPRRRSPTGGSSGFDWSKVNVNGGAIALGHPIGASRRTDRRDAAPRAGAPPGPVRPRDAVPRRRRLGRDGVRAGLSRRFARSAAEFSHRLRRARRRATTTRGAGRASSASRRLEAGAPCSTLDEAWDAIHLRPDGRQPRPRLAAPSARSRAHPRRHLALRRRGLIVRSGADEATRSRPARRRSTPSRATIRRLAPLRSTPDSEGKPSSTSFQLARPTCPAPAERSGTATSTPALSRRRSSSRRGREPARRPTPQPGGTNPSRPVRRGDQPAPPATAGGRGRVRRGRGPGGPPRAWRRGRPPAAPSAGAAGSIIVSGEGTTGSGIASARRPAGLTAVRRARSMAAIRPPPHARGATR